MAEEGGGKGDGKGRASTKGDLSVCRDFLRNVCTRGDRWDPMLSFFLSLVHGMQLDYGALIIMALQV